MTVSTPTRERILDAAMELFSQLGYSGTSVAQIEAAAGLTPGSGGLYHHFRTKEEVLAAGIDRHLARLRALRDIRNLLTGLGDLRSELTITARYALAELDRERELLQILATEARARPQLIQPAADQLFGTSSTEFASWLADRAGQRLPPDRARALAAIGLSALISSRILSLLGLTSISIDDDALVAAWTDMMIATITQTRLQ